MNKKIEKMHSEQELSDIVTIIETDPEKARLITAFKAGLDAATPEKQPKSAE